MHFVGGYGSLRGAQQYPHLLKELLSILLHRKLFSMTIVTFRHIISPYLHACQDLPIYLIPIITANDIHLNTSKRMY